MSRFATLLLPDKRDPELGAVGAAWTRRGGDVRRPGKFWIRDESLAGRPIALYGGQAFALLLAQLYGVQLLSPDESLLARLAPEWTKRAIILTRKGDLRDSDFPMFLKPVVPKLFAAGIFATRADFEHATAGLDDAEALMRATIITHIRAEARSFVLDGALADIALYEGGADLSAATRFLETFLEQHARDLPRAVVIDLALSETKGWLILEFNACWGAGLNGCRADRVLDCIAAASVPGLPQP